MSRRLYVAPVKQAPRNVVATSTMTKAGEAEIDEIRETLVGRTFGVRAVAIHGDGLGCRIWLGRGAK